MNYQTALRFAQLDLRICEQDMENLARAWLAMDPEHPSYHARYTDYCEATVRWHAANAKLHRLHCETEGRKHLWRVA